MPIIVDRPYYVETTNIKLKEFIEEKHQYVTRPPYQRKNVWSVGKKQALIDSFFRRYYVPGIVLREVGTSENRLVYEMIDGQQRIIAIQEFFNNEFKLPSSLKDITGGANKYYKDLSSDVQDHLKGRSLEATIITGLTHPDNQEHQHHVTEIFWRLQQGESLSYIEQEHSKLYSAARNYITKYADDISFDYGKYEPIDYNPDRHPFFGNIISMDNKRLQHLSLLARFLMLEFGGGPIDLGKEKLGDFIDRWDGKSSEKFENKDEVKNCKKTLDILYNIFKSDPSVGEGSSVPELDREYLILSVYLLARRLVHGDWNFKEVHYEKFREFVHNFYQRWKNPDDDDTEMHLFRDQRQQNKVAIETRDQIISKLFFEENPGLDKRDPQRNFTYHQRIKIYRKQKGLCQECLNEGWGEEEAVVPWKQFDADHLKPHSKGGKSTVKNGQVLCRYHNRSKGGKYKENN